MYVHRLTHASQTQMEFATSVRTCAPMLYKLRQCQMGFVTSTLTGARIRGGSKNFRKGGRNSTFQCGFQSFSYKSLTNIPAKGGGGAARPAPPLNLRLRMLHKLRWNSPEVRARFHPGFTNSDGVRHKYAQGRTYASESQMEVVTSMCTKRVLQ